METTSKIISQTLLNCPFCGEIPKLETGYRHTKQDGWVNEIKLSCCIEMNGSNKDSNNFSLDITESKLNLYKRWNKRNSSSFKLFFAKSKVFTKK